MGECVGSKHTKLGTPIFLRYFLLYSPLTRILLVYECLAGGKLLC
nr:MAG TPA: hypothetical protein [Caudoviricetes sp.]